MQNNRDNSPESRDLHARAVKQFFSVHAPDWKDSYLGCRCVLDLILQARMNIALGFVDRYLAPATKVLDVGTGTGVCALRLVQKGHFVEGLDLAEEMIAKCEERFSGSGARETEYRLRVGDFMRTDIPAESFDCVLALGFLEYQRDERSVLERIHGVLKNDGLLVCSGPIALSMASLFGCAPVLRRGLAWGASARTRGRGGISYEAVSVNRYSAARFGRLLSTSGFQLIDFKRHGFGGFPLFNRMVGVHVEIAVDRLLTKASSVVPLDLVANDIVVVAKKRQLR